jgi:hypothetical protein
MDKLQQYFNDELNIIISRQLYYDNTNNEYVLNININKPIKIKLNNDILIENDKDLHFINKGELSLTTKDNNICIDTINSKLYFNSRKSKILKDTDEAKIYLTKLYFDQNKQILNNINNQKNENNIINGMLNRINNLEKELKELKKCQE